MVISIVILNPHRKVTRRHWPWGSSDVADKTIALFISFNCSGLNAFGFTLKMFFVLSGDVLSRETFATRLSGFCTPLFTWESIEHNSYKGEFKFLLIFCPDSVPLRRNSALWTRNPCDPRIAVQVKVALHLQYTLNRENLLKEKTRESSCLIIASSNSYLSYYLWD